MKYLSALVVCSCLLAQDTPPEATTAAPVAQPGGYQQYGTQDKKRILGIMPNFRTTSVNAKDIVKLSSGDKFKLAARDAFDPGAFFTTAILTGVSHWQQQYYPAIPLGAKGYGERYALNFLDNTSSTFLSEAVIPSLTHQDPRYFRLGEGSIKKRLGYSLSRLLIARSDKGKWVVNGGQLGGGFAAGALANLYYPASQRSVENTFIRFGINLGTDGLSNLGREFWPDIAKLMSRHKKP
jgi:hypothetical protein